LLKEYTIKSWVILPPHLFNVHISPSETKNLEITKSAIKEHLFENKQSYLHFICPWFFFGLICSSQKLFKVLSICVHARCQSLCPLVDGCINNIPLQTARC